MVLLIATLAGLVIWASATPFMSDTSKNPEITDGERETVEGLAKLYGDRRAETERQLEEMRQRGKTEIEVVPCSSGEDEEVQLPIGSPELPASAPSQAASQDPD